MAHSLRYWLPFSPVTALNPVKTSSARRSPHERNPAVGDEIMSEADNSTPNAGAFKPKKSVALSGVTAGNTALCTVG
ncbi:hypothetical protein, partial [Paraburkholderia fungorum]|uniref:hypothetical protein n=1 Tax=Paraburkholderia fungorum TaxID=134537 RepID=UPI003CD0CD8B